MSNHAVEFPISEFCSELVLKDSKVSTIRNLLTLAIGACLSFALCSANGFAQGYPAKPVRIIVPISAGSGVDIIARTLAEQLTLIWGQKVFVENRPGKGGTIGTAEVAKAEADGYTLLANTSGHAASPSLYKSLPYDTLIDFVEVAGIGSLSNVLVTKAGTGITSVSGLIEAIKTKPGQLKFGSAGTGTGVHLNAEKFKLSAGFDATHLPSNGGPEAIADTVSGRVVFFFSPISIALPPVREGKLVALAVSSAKRSTLLPDVPTVAEAALPGFEFTLWNGLWAPARIPPDVMAILTRDVPRALASPGALERLTKLGITPMNLTQSEFAKFVRSEIEDYARIARAAGIQDQ